MYRLKLVHYFSASLAQSLVSNGIYITLSSPIHECPRAWFKSNTKFQEQIQKNENDCTVHGVRNERETKQRIDFEIDFRLVWMMFTFFRVMLFKSEDFTCFCSITQFPDWMYLFIFFSLWLFDHRHFNFIHSGMIFTLLFSSWWEWSGIRLTYKQHCIYMFHGVPCHVINLYQSKLLANKFNENKNCPVILAFVCSKIVFCRTFSSFCTASWILIERWEWIKICFVRVCIRQLI